VTWLRRYRALSAVERRTLWLSVFLLPLSATSIRACGLGLTAGMLRRLYPRQSRSRNLPDVQRTARIVRGVATRMGVGCLPQSAVLACMLAASGIAAGFRIGVSKTGDGRLAAHAWVEVDCVPLAEDAEVLSRYEALPALPAR
jgi:hypothetical protein